MSGGEDNRLTVTDTHTGRIVRSVSLGHDFADVTSNPRLELGIVIDGRAQHAFFLTDKAVVAVDLTTGQRHAVVTLGSATTDAGFGALLEGPQGSPVVAYSDSALGLVDLTSGTMRRIAGAVPGAPANEPISATAVPTTRTAYELVDGALWSTNLQTGARTAWHARSGVSLASVAASGDGRVVATADGQSQVQILGSRVATRDAHARRGPVVHLWLDDTGSHLVTVRSDGTMAVWQPRTGTMLGELPLVDVQSGVRGFGWQTAANFAPDGNLWTATAGLGLYAWNMSPSAWRRIACATVGRQLTRDEWQRYLGIGYAPRSKC